MPSLKKTSRTLVQLLCWVFIASIITGCASVTPDYEKPRLHVTSIKLLPADGLSQRFKIGLRIINPNDTPLPLKGIFYSVSIEDYELVSGASGNLQDVPAYGESDFSVTASTDVFNGARLLHELLTNPRDMLSYSFNGRLDLSQWWIPSVNVKESGEITLLK
ncbi:LEA type 2 family protein [Aestuariirhabdus sp. Z084]|uniref:LEA type 2 family protein n=1 Tax=Aestuariirhabdus haliotis TaxID=2918751 RepID=UPI00201B43DE|nr:LEA type 2 family protein [Aestuariirhabdus haliotis]MCL6416456.1 LEA type 2 family protein [Aestuariirhabdus haliotis]MCL6420446.1 LEA type 2 family protein [Aestuariirhabdus haliotis]